MPEINTDLARSFQKIVSGGWAQHSNGDVESPTGHFAYIPISTNELDGLVDACLDDDDARPIEEQYYVLIEDSNGNASLYIYGSVREGLDQFNHLTHAYDTWMLVDDDNDDEQGLEPEWVVACQECGEEFDNISIAQEHENDESTESDCTDSLYTIKNSLA